MPMSNKEFIKFIAKEKAESVREFRKRLWQLQKQIDNLGNCNKEWYRQEADYDKVHRLRDGKKQGEL